MHINIITHGISTLIRGFSMCITRSSAFGERVFGFGFSLSHLNNATLASLSCYLLVSYWLHITSALLKKQMIGMSHHFIFEYSSIGSRVHSSDSFKLPHLGFLSGVSDLTEDTKETINIKLTKVVGLFYGWIRWKTEEITLLQHKKNNTEQQVNCAN